MTVIDIIFFQNTINSIVNINYNLLNLQYLITLLHIIVNVNSFSKLNLLVFIRIKLLLNPMNKNFLFISKDISINEEIKY